MTAALPLFPAFSPDDVQARLRDAFGPCSVWRTPGAADLLMFAPTPERPQYLLMTCGASSVPMRTPDGTPAHAEFGLLLDADWPVDQVDRGEAMWPLRLLTQVAALVRGGQWLGCGHVVHLQAALPGTGFTHALVAPTIDIPQDVVTLDGGSVILYGLLPCYAPEVQFTHGRPLGGITLISRFLDARLSERVQIGRPLVISAAEQAQRVLHLN